jgi:hypothetical protein
VEVFELAPENEQPPAVETAEAAEQARVSLVTKKVGVFLDGVGIGTPGPEDATSARRFDSGPMVRFAIDEGHYVRAQPATYSR